MDQNPKPHPGFYYEEQCSLDEFINLIERDSDLAKLRFATEIKNKVPIYHAPSLKAVLANRSRHNLLMAEMADVFMNGAGVIVLKRAYEKMSAIDAATGIYHRIISREKEENAAGADHFAAAGNNDRIWNSLQKLCLEAPDVFVDYFSNPAIDAVCEAWLGPAYQMTAQINLVRPGGKAQQPHRDYHLGFQTAQACARFPAHAHGLSPVLTLQGGIAHTDMPVESGPTKLLPFSQTYQAGYAAYRRGDFRQCFEERYVQLPLEKGDAIFFNPALFHAAGDNKSADIQRMVNLLQISSPFGRAMESVDRIAMCKSIYQPLQQKWKAGLIDENRLNALIASTAEGYSFPTNLDRDPPIGGLAPKTQQALLREAIISDSPQEEFFNELDALIVRQQP